MSPAEGQGISSTVYLQGLKRERREAASAAKEQKKQKSVAEDAGADVAE